MKKPSRKSKAALLGPARPPVAPAVYRVSECAKRLGVTEQRVLNLIDEGRLAAINVGLGERRFWRIPMTEVDRLKRRASV